MTDGNMHLHEIEKLDPVSCQRHPVLSAFIAAADHTRVSVSIKLCSLLDDIYVIGRLIFSHCNYRPRSMKYKCVRLLPCKSALTRQQWVTPARTRAGKSSYSVVITKNREKWLALTTQQHAWAWCLSKGSEILGCTTNQKYYQSKINK